MKNFFEHIGAGLWNRLQRRHRGAWREEGKGLGLGYRVRDEERTRQQLAISSERRTMHLAVLGKTGSGKSSFLRYLASQDIAADRGFLYFDLHGDATPFLLRVINARERREHRHLDNRVILLEPADPLVSLGLNPLNPDGATDFVRIAEFAQVLKQRWALDHFGARTDELLRNSLYVLAANHLTLIELSLLLSHSGFRAACMKQVENHDIRQYFELRYDPASDAMQATMREPILNKTSAFTADPHFRHIVGQQRSSFSLREAMDDGQWVIVNLNKGQLGEQALTLGSLIFTMLKSALFRRERRSLFTLFCDEIQNLVAFGSGIETVLSEARKFGVGVVSANQFLNQYPPDMRAAILSVGTHAFFQLTGEDAGAASQLLDGGKPLAERLKNLPQRRAIVKTGAERWAEIEVPAVRTPEVDPTDLINRARLKRGTVRHHIERDIRKRHEEYLRSNEEVLDAWD